MSVGIVRRSVRVGQPALVDVRPVVRVHAVRVVVRRVVCGAGGAGWHVPKGRRRNSPEAVGHAGAGPGKRVDRGALQRRRPQRDGRQDVAGRRWGKHVVQPPRIGIGGIVPETENGIGWVDGRRCEKNVKKKHLRVVHVGWRKKKPSTDSKCRLPPRGLYTLRGRRDEQTTRSARERRTRDDVARSRNFSSFRFFLFFLRQQNVTKSLNNHLRPYRSVCARITDNKQSAVEWVVVLLACDRRDSKENRDKVFIHPGLYHGIIDSGELRFP